jgi:hypothetical protein
VAVPFKFALAAALFIIFVLYLARGWKHGAPEQTAL